MRQEVSVFKGRRQRRSAIVLSEMVLLRPHYKCGAPKKKADLSAHLFPAIEVAKTYALLRSVPPTGVSVSSATFAMGSFSMSGSRPNSLSLR